MKPVNIFPWQSYLLLLQLWYIWLPLGFKGLKGRLRVGRIYVVVLCWNYCRSPAQNDSLSEKLCADDGCALALAQARRELFMAEWEVHTCSSFLLDCLHVFWNLDQNPFRLYLTFDSAKRAHVCNFLIRTHLSYSGFPVRRFNVNALKNFCSVQPKFVDHYLLQQRPYIFMVSVHVMEALGVFGGFCSPYANRFQRHCVG